MIYRPVVRNKRGFEAGSLDEAVKFSRVIQPSGNSLGLCITWPVGQMACIHWVSRVIIEVVAKGLLVKPDMPARKRLQLSYFEAQLAEGPTPRRAPADELPTPLPSGLVH